jgi:hypothetical protein
LPCVAHRLLPSPVWVFAWSRQCHCALFEGPSRASDLR